jgi:glycosyltransferase involved in cell wall biosynthesis
MIGWLVNDFISCIPNTKTLWTDLLEFLPNLQDKTGYGYDILPDKIEELAVTDGEPNYIIRNSCYFRRLNFKSPTIAFVQDPHRDANQIDVCNHSTTVICSEWIRNLFGGLLTGRVEIIPTGVDFSYFDRNKPYGDYSYYSEWVNTEELGILPESILFIGANQYNKGFHYLMDLITSTNYNFTCIFKDNTKIQHPRVRCFNQISTEQVFKIMCGCKLFLCLSLTEPQHVSGVEAGACGLPIVANNVGWYYDGGHANIGGMTETEWGIVVHDNNYKQGVDRIFTQKELYNPRKFLKENGYDRPDYEKKWVDLVNEVSGNSKCEEDYDKQTN